MENQEIINEEKGNDVNHVLATVPYQKCPVCGGRGIIPMHIVNEELLKISSKNYGEDGVGLSSEEISKLL
jgi:hypothetical protein